MTMGDRIVVLNGGIIQQANTPEHIYSWPENMFVAGFIGSPAMNFIETRILPDKTIKLGNYMIYPDDNLSAVIKNNNLADKNVVVGIRPEHFSAAETELRLFPSLLKCLEVKNSCILISLCPGTSSPSRPAKPDLRA